MQRGFSAETGQFSNITLHDESSHTCEVAAPYRGFLFPPGRRGAMVFTRRLSDLEAPSHGSNSRCLALEGHSFTF